MQQIPLLGLGQAAGVGGQEDVGGAVGGLALEALQQGVGLGADQIDDDPGLGGEGVEQRFDENFLARRIDIDLGAGGDGLGRRSDPERQQQGRRN